MSRWMVLLALFAGICAYGQDEAPRVGLIRVLVPTAFLVRPIANTRSFGIVRAGVRLLWVEGQQDSGYLRVIGAFGPIGWVVASDVQILQPSPNAPRVESAKRPCKGSLSECPLIGCARPNSPEAAANETKKRLKSSPARIGLSFRDLAVLQTQAQKLVGQRKVPADRRVLSNFQISTGTVDEGSLVLVTGFIAANDLGPHPNTGESVNCNLSSASENDFHINITSSPHLQEFNGFVVEMIPQGRPDAWSLIKLQAIRKSQRRVLVAGALFYDSIHVVNDDPKHPIGGQPKRFSLWEVHPIAAFFVCNRQDNQCNPGVESEWTSLDQFSSN